MTTGLLKRLTHRLGTPGKGCWAFENTTDSTTISGKFYGLVVPDRHEEKLDNLSCREETEFWQLNFAIGHEALSRLQQSTNEAHNLLIGVNDGYYVGQSIPHVHSHIVVAESSDATKEFFPARDMANAFDSLRQAFCPAAAAPLMRMNFVCDLQNLTAFTHELKYRREVLRESHMDMFRIYTGSPLQSDMDKIPIVIDAGNNEAPMFSFSQAWRALNGRMPFQRLKMPLGRGKFTHFEPAPEMAL